MDVSFSGAGISAGQLTHAIVGTCTVDAYFSDPDPGVSVGQSGDFTLLGTTRRCTVVAFSAGDGFARARLRGGAGKLDAELPPQAWRGYQAGQIARECVAEAGETVGPGWDSLSTTCEHWQRPRGSLRDALRRLSRLTDDLHWRVDPDGSVALHSEGWPDAGDSVDREAFDWPHESLCQWWPTDSALGPGSSATLFGVARRFTRVEYRWSPKEITCRGWY